MLNELFKVALFDVDGTLVDSEGQYSVFWGDMGKRYHPEIDNFCDVIKGTTLTQILNKYFPVEKHEQIEEELDAYEAQMKFEFVEGAEDFVRDIHGRGVKCAVVTSSNEKKMSSLRRCIPYFDDLFDRVLTAEMFTASKPNPDCYLLGAKVFDAKIEECVVFEDALTGLEAGMRAGMFTIGFPTTNPREVIESRCSLVVDSFKGLSYEEIVDHKMNFVGR